MAFKPEELFPGAGPLFEDMSGDIWVPLYRQECTFSPENFFDQMMNMIKNPNINSSWLYRADIIYDDQVAAHIGPGDEASRPRVREIRDIARQRILVRTLVPRNDRRDDPMNQTCSFHTSKEDDGTIRSIILYIPHISSPDEMPFYHPAVEGIAHYHEWNPSTQSGSVSIHFLPFPGEQLQDKKVLRTGYHLLQAIHKHGHGAASGYVKRVHHDRIVPQARLQGRYAGLKKKYAKSLMASWKEVTDPNKHVFEDLCIAAFLMELWTEMFPDFHAFPGFVDIGCGNGLLVYILNQEGFNGWGFDARERKSWYQYSSATALSPSGLSLEQRVLLPNIISEEQSGLSDQQTVDGVHNGIFPTGTFIISNHADELTPWTPLLAAMSRCPFIMIPCCSHDFTGAKFRAPVPRDRSKSDSTYASLVDWVTKIAEDCGWEVETEMLRIPSTRNTGLLGRRMKPESQELDAQDILKRYGGATGFGDNVMQLLKSNPRAH